MKYKVIVLSIIFLPLVISCSAVPGDAAYRAGHPEQAADLYKQGADQGDSSAALRLGLLISEGKVSTADYGDAIKWYKRSCKLGNNTGCHNAGNAYEYGKKGANKDYNKAREYYSLAAERGYMQSQYNLGSLYSNQYIKNDLEGSKWMFIALNTANNCLNIPLCQWVQEDPPGHREKLQGRMNNIQIEKAKESANAWKAKK